MLVDIAWEVGLGVDRNIALEGDHTVPEEDHTGLGEGRIDLEGGRKKAGDVEGNLRHRRRSNLEQTWYR